MLSRVNLLRRIIYSACRNPAVGISRFPILSPFSEVVADDRGGQGLSVSFHVVSGRSFTLRPS